MIERQAVRENPIEQRIEQVSKDLNPERYPGLNIFVPKALRRINEVIGETASEVEELFGIKPLNFGLDYQTRKPAFAAYYVSRTHTVYFSYSHFFEIGLDFLSYFELLDTYPSRYMYVALAKSILKEDSEYRLRHLVAHEAYHAKVETTKTDIRQRRRAHLDEVLQNGRKPHPYYDDLEQHNAEAFAYLYTKRKKTEGFGGRLIKIFKNFEARVDLERFHKRGIHIKSK